MKYYIEKANHYITALCEGKPNRRTGSVYNKEATTFFGNTIRQFGYEVDDMTFPALDYDCRHVSLTIGEHSFEVFVSPYSLGCDVTSELTTASTLEELKEVRCDGKILLLKGELCEEQLAPKNFVFYNPDEHKEIIEHLEKAKPEAIIAATGKNPDLVGALYPFPLFVDGDFDIPNVYCKDVVAEEMLFLDDKTVHLRIDASRIPTTSSNVLATLSKGNEKKFVIGAHIDTNEYTPGALDNASGTVVLLLVAEMLADYQGKFGIEILAINGEDHYSAAGEMDYLNRYGDELSNIMVFINIDDVGYIKGKTEYSFYECNEEIEKIANTTLGKFGGLKKGEQWYAGDHMCFVQNGVPAIAITSEFMLDLLKTITHTSADTPDMVDTCKLVEVAMAINELVRDL